MAGYHAWFIGHDLITPAATTAKASFKSLSSVTKITTSAMAGLGIAMGVQGLVRIMKAATQAAAEFEDQIGRINTLLPQSSALSGQLAEATTKFSTKYGLAIADVTDATFDAVSAGIKHADVLEFVNVASMHAVGGHNSLKDSVGGLTTVLNAYNLEVSEAERVADAFFVTNKIGLTTIGDLSHHIGIVAKTAAVADISFREMLSAVAAITQQLGPGRTSDAMTQLSSLIMSMLRPTRQSRDAAEELGIEWTGTALSAKGLVEMLRIYKRSLDTNREATVRLTRRKEALRAALVLTSEKGFATLTQSIHEMNTKIGQAAEAYGKMETRALKLRQAQSSLDASLRKLGNLTLPIVSGYFEVIATQIAAMTGLFDSWGGALQSLLSINPASAPLMLFFNQAAAEVKETEGLLADLSEAEKLAHRTVAKHRKEWLTSLAKARAEHAAERAKQAEMDRKYMSAEQRRWEAHIEWWRSAIYPTYAWGQKGREEMYKEQTAALAKMLKRDGRLRESAARKAETARKKAIGRAMRASRFLWKIEEDERKERQKEEDEAADERAKVRMDRLDRIMKADKARLDQETAAKLYALRQVMFAEEIAAERYRQQAAERAEIANEIIQTAQLVGESAVLVAELVGASAEKQARAEAAAITAVSVIKAAYHAAEAFAAAAAEQWGKFALHTAAAIKYGLVAAMNIRIAVRGPEKDKDSGGFSGSGSFRDRKAPARREFEQRTTIIYMTVQGSVIRDGQAGRWIEEATERGWRDGASRVEPLPRAVEVA